MKSLCELNGFFVLSSLKMYLRASDMEKVEEFLEIAQNYNNGDWFELLSNYFVLLWKIKTYEEFGTDATEESEIVNHSPLKYFSKNMKSRFHSLH